MRRTARSNLILRLKLFILTLLSEHIEKIMYERMACVQLYPKRLIVEFLLKHIKREMTY